MRDTNEKTLAAGQANESAKETTQGDYTTVQKLTISQEQISEFCQALFLNATKPGYVQLRCFRDDGDGTALTPWHAVLVDPNEDEPTAKLEAEAARVAQRAANTPRPVVFAPPVVLLNSRVKAEESNRSEERRVGKECYIGCRSRWSPYH